MPHFDVAIVGGGVLGSAIAAQLSQTDATVCVLESATDVGEGASKGNAGVALSFYGKPGSLEANLASATYPRWEEVSRRLDVPYRRLGGLMVAVNEEEASQLPRVHEEATACGVRCELLSGSQAVALEPLITDQCRGAVWLPDEGVIDPMRLTIAFAELAARNGASFHLSSPVIGFEHEGERISTISTPRETISADYVVNAAGLGFGVVNELAGGEQIRMWPRMGEYWILDREFGNRLNHIVFATELPDTKGIHVVPTTSGTVLLGPSAEDGGSPDKPTHEATLDLIFRSAQRLVPSVSIDYAIKTYAANRPASDENIRVRMDAQVPNLLLVSNRSTGVGTSLGAAELAVELLRGAGLAADPRQDAIVSNPTVPRLRHEPEPEKLVEIDARYGQVVCVCEQVSAAEIGAAFESPLPARSVAGVWKRTHATGGRCQGSVCLAGVAFMCSLALGVPPDAVPMTEIETLGIS